MLTSLLHFYFVSDTLHSASPLIVIHNFEVAVMLVMSFRCFITSSPQRRKEEYQLEED